MLGPDTNTAEQAISGGREPAGDDIPVTSVGHLLPGQRMSWLGSASLQVKLALIVVPVMVLALCMLLIVLMTSAAEDGLKPWARGRR